MAIILSVNVTKDNIYAVLRKIEKEYPNHRWAISKDLPTGFIPQDAKYINIYDDNDITCSINIIEAEHIIAAYDFLNDVSDNVNHPEHYQGKNECIDVMIAMFGIEAVKHFCMCNAYKYRFRADKKNGAEDIAKAEWYESKLIELNNLYK